MAVAILHYPCGCRMSMRGETVVRWQRCHGHEGTLAFDLFRRQKGEAHALEERAACKDPRCHLEAAKLEKSKQNPWNTR